MLRICSVTLVCSLALTAVVNGDYTLTPTSGGLSQIIRNPGTSFTLNFLLTSDGSNEHTSAIFDVSFSPYGILYTDYAWGSPYETGDGNVGIYDWSDPSPESGPQLNSGDSPAGPINFQNFLPSGSFSTGTLLSLVLTVPADHPGGQVIIRAIPDTFDDGFGSILTDPGEDFCA